MAPLDHALHGLSPHLAGEVVKYHTVISISDHLTFPTPQTAWKTTRVNSSKEFPNGPGEDCGSSSLWGFGENLREMERSRSMSTRP